MNVIFFFFSFPVAQQHSAQTGIRVSCRLFLSYFKSGFKRHLLSSLYNNSNLNFIITLYLFWCVYYLFIFSRMFLMVKLSFFSPEYPWLCIMLVTWPNISVDEKKINMMQSRRVCIRGIHNHLKWMFWFFFF